MASCTAVYSQFSLSASDSMTEPSELGYSSDLVISASMSLVLEIVEKIESSYTDDGLARSLLSWLKVPYLR